MEDGVQNKLFEVPSRKLTLKNVNPLKWLIILLLFLTNTQFVL